MAADTKPGVELIAAGTGRTPDRLPLPYRPRFPWIGGDLQTLRNHVRPPSDFVAERRERIVIPLSAAGAGALVASVDRPVGAARGGPVLLVHGLGGCEDSAYMRIAARALVSRGRPVIRLNLRGAGPSAATSAAPYHAGLTADLRDVFSALESMGPLLAMGFSLGGHLLLKLASEAECPARLAGIVTVSAPLDLADAERRIAAPRNRIYERALVRWMKRTMLESNGSSVPSPGELAGIRHIRDFDRAFVVPAFGFRDVADYYQVASVAGDVASLCRPVLVLHGVDDPWIPAAPYRVAPWPDRENLLVLLVRGAGHVGFHGRSARDPWYIGAFEAFCAACGIDGPA